MMKKYFELSIHNPCNEQKESFTKTSNGSFCKSCQKEVIDFSKMSDVEIRDYFKNYDGQKTCGQFLPEQLKTYQTNQQKLSSAQKIWTTGALGISASLLGATEIAAQETNTTIQVERLEIEKTSTIITQKTPKVKSVSGVVTAEGIPIPGVNVTLKNTNLNTITDFEGKYTFPSLLKEGDELVFYHAGYKIQNHIISVTNNNETQLQKALYPKLNIALKPSNLCIMGEVAVVKNFKSKKSYWKKRSKKTKFPK